MQAVIVNEFNKRLGYYKLWYVENMIRGFARRHSNSFHLSIFACCREVFENNKDCVPGPFNVAINKLNERFKAIEMAKQQAQTVDDAIRQAKFHKLENMKLKEMLAIKEESKSDDEAEQQETADKPDED